jgi:hypothetical protein
MWCVEGHACSLDIRLPDLNFEYPQNDHNLAAKIAFGLLSVERI